MVRVGVWLLFDYSNQTELERQQVANYVKANEARGQGQRFLSSRFFEVKDSPRGPHPCMDLKNYNLYADPNSVPNPISRN